MDIILENKLQIIVITVVTVIAYILLSAKQKQEEEQQQQQQHGKNQPLQQKQAIVPSSTSTADADAASVTTTTATVAATTPIEKQESIVNNKESAPSQDQFVEQNKSQVGREKHLKASVSLDETSNNITKQEETSPETVAPLKNEERNEKSATVVIDRASPVVVTKKHTTEKQSVEPPVGIIGERLQYRTDRQVINNKSPAKLLSNASEDQPKLTIHKKTRASTVTRRPKTKTNQKSLKEAMKDADQLLSKVQSIDLPSPDKPLPSSDETQEPEAPKKSLAQILAKSGGNVGPKPMGGFNLAAITSARNKLKKTNNVTSDEDDVFKNEYENA